jgi:hypothetical protein
LSAVAGWLIAIFAGNNSADGFALVAGLLRWVYVSFKLWPFAQNYVNN